MPRLKPQIVFDINLQTRNIQIELGLMNIHDFQILKPEYDFSPITQKIIQSIQTTNSLETIKDDAIIALYRAFYWHKLHIDPTKVRPAAEALIRRILSHKEIPKINPLVDAYNYASIASHIPMGAYDQLVTLLPYHLHFTTSQESFTPIGKPTVFLEPDILVLSDSNSTILCQYPYRDSQKTIVNDHSQEIIVIAYGVPGISRNQLQTALECTQEYLSWLQSQKIIQYSAEDLLFFSNSF